MDVVGALSAAVLSVHLLNIVSDRRRRRHRRRAFRLDDHVRPNILGLKPYRCARDDYDSGILLDANENSFGPTLAPGDDALAQGVALERYPCPYQWELKGRIADYRGVAKEQIFLGVGSDEAIDLLIRVFCRPGRDAILITPPTYGMYSVCACVNDVEVVEVPLTPRFEVPVAKLLAGVTPRTKIVFLCSPGNPTATLIPLAVVEAVLQQFTSGIVVIDEAYIDFASPAENSACSLVDRYPHAVVLQTFSKAFGLAGIRIGMAISNAETIQILNNVKAPYNVNKITARTALQAMSQLDVLDRHVGEILGQRQRVMRELAEIPAVRKVHPSDSNFILFQVDDAHSVYKTMASRGVVIRYRGSQTHCADCLRMTVGTSQENTEFIRLLRDLTGNKGT